MRLEGFSKLLAWAVFLSALSCSSADPPAPPQGCQDFIDIWCNKNAEWHPPSDRARSVEDCEITAKLEIACSRARALAPTYGSCLGVIVFFMLRPPPRCKRFPYTAPGLGPHG